MMTNTYILRRYLSLSHTRTHTLILTLSSSLSLSILYTHLNTHNIHTNTPTQHSHLYTRTHTHKHTRVGHLASCYVCSNSKFWANRWKMGEKLQTSRHWRFPAKLIISDKTWNFWKKLSFFKLSSPPHGLTLVEKISALEIKLGQLRYFFSSENCMKLLSEQCQNRLGTLNRAKNVSVCDLLSAILQW